jgi:hypothetical protein
MKAVRPDRLVFIIGHYFVGGHYTAPVISVMRL